MDKLDANLAVGLAMNQTQRFVLASSETHKSVRHSLPFALTVLLQHLHQHLHQHQHQHQHRNKLILTLLVYASIVRQDHASLRDLGFARRL